MKTVFFIICLSFVSNLMVSMQPACAADTDVVVGHQGAHMESETDRLQALLIVSLLEQMRWPDFDDQEAVHPRLLCFMYHSDDGCISFLRRYERASPYVQMKQITALSRDSLLGCQALLVDQTQASFLLHSLQQWSLSSLVTIGTSEDFVARGGGLAVFVRRGALQVAVNARQLNAAGVLLGAMPVPK